MQPRAINTEETPPLFSTPAVPWQPEQGLPVSFPPPPEGLAFFAPQFYESRYAYPLVVWFPTPGAEESELGTVMPALSRRNYVGLSIRWNGPFRGRDLSEPGFELRQRVRKAVDTARLRFHLHPGRVFLGGVGRAGELALLTALADPAHYAGVFSLGGGFPRAGCPLQRFRESVGLPTLLLQEPEVASAEWNSDVTLLQLAALDVTAKRMPQGNAPAPAALAEVNRWLMKLIAQHRC